MLADGGADMVSMARPLLADPDFVNKAAAGRADEINTCIACNQACLDHIFQRKIASCLVNPRACHETELRATRRPRAPKRIAVVGAGPAGLAVRDGARRARPRVDLFEAAAEIGGQFNLAKRIPGKEEFRETLRYFARRIEVTGVRPAPRHARRRADDLLAGGYDEVVLATGVTPRDPGIPGEDEHRARAGALLRRRAARRGGPVGPARGDRRRGRHRLRRRRVPGRATATRPTLDLASLAARMGRGATRPRRAAASRQPQVAPPAARGDLLQRKAAPLGKGLGKTTGWIHRAALQDEARAR